MKNKLGGGKMKRFALYFFWDKNGIVDDYNIYLLNDLKKNVDYLLVVSNGKLTKEGYQKFEAVSDRIFERENKGFDVWAYKEGLQVMGWEALSKYDEVIMLNYTNYGPVYPFKEMFDEMDKLNVDFWGITEHYGLTFDPYGKCKYGYIPRHIQSSFIAVRNNFLMSNDFKSYWDQMPEVHDYADAICLHEAIFTEDFTRRGYKSAVYVKTEDLKSFSDYPLMLYPKELIKNRRCPIFKRKTFYNLYEEFLDISCGQTGLELYEYLRDETNYNLDMVWDNLLRTANMSDIKERMQLNYVLPQTYAKTNEYSQKKIALFMHIYNEDLINYCKKYAQSMPKYADILITTNTKTKCEKIMAAFSDLGKDRVKVIEIKNRGRDVSALLVGLKPYYKDYDYICFAHDKKSEYDKPYMIGESFSYQCFENVLATKEYVKNIITLFDENPRLGLAVPPIPCHGPYYITIGCEWQNNYENVKNILKEWNIDIPMDSAKPPIAPLGTMFWFRTSALEKMFERDWKYEDFEEEPIKVKDGGFIHAIERIYPFMVQEAGFYTCWIMSDNFAKIEITNLFKMLRDANQTMFWNLGVDDRHQELHKISCMKNELEVTKLALIKSWGEKDALESVIERWKYPKGVSDRIKMIMRAMLGKQIYSKFANAFNKK